MAQEMLLRETEDLWQMLCRRREEGRLPPVYLYGMGDGADKCLAALERLSIPVTGVFASDEFVRGQSFRGFPVQRYSQARAEHPDLLALLCFAVDYEPMLSRLTEMASEVELYAPDLPVIPDESGRLFDRAYLLEHKAEFDEVYALLADEASRRVWRSLLDGKLSGRIAYLREAECPREEAWQELAAPGSEEHFLDLGAYNGDTVQAFLELTGGRYATIRAMEPDGKNYEKLCRRLEGLPRTTAWNMAAGSEPGVAMVRKGRRGRGSGISAQGTIPIPVNAVDDLLQGQPVTIAKLDVEGAEAAALRGMANTIRQWRPRLIVSGYHRIEDLFALPLLVREIEPSYRVYLRKHPYVPGWESVFYFC